MVLELESPWVQLHGVVSKEQGLNVYEGHIVPENGVLPWDWLLAPPTTTGCISRGRHLTVEGG